MTLRSGRVVEFEGYFFELISGELTRNGAQIKVSKQVADMLALLISNPGRIITREEIREAL